MRREVDTPWFWIRPQSDEKAVDIFVDIRLVRVVKLA